MILNRMPRTVGVHSKRLLYYMVIKSFVSKTLFLGYKTAYVIPNDSLSVKVVYYTIQAAIRLRGCAD